MSDFESCKKWLDDCRAEAAKRVVGQQQVIDGILIALLTGGHILLEGVPGLAKTLAVKTFAEISGLDFKRIQFTPDLLPADVTGTLIYESQSGRFTVRKGPVFTNVVLADEINRSPAKVQSALLEAMAEHQVTIGEETYRLPEPFLVLATQNPIEQEGTYNLPEAELDRFLLKLIVSYPTAQEEAQIVKTAGRAAEISVNKVLDAKKLADCRALLEQVTCDDKIIDYIVSVVAATRPVAEKKAGGRLAVSTVKKDDVSRYISYGASPRSGIALLQCAKVYALFAGRSFVLPEDVKAAAPAVLRHRLVLSYEAAADGITADDVINRILNLVQLP
ncbi:MAG: MoxR family ATPase [Treponema sp.]|nr:MoxR family ATPase [Treponema sp.]